MTTTTLRDPENGIIKTNFSDAFESAELEAQLAPFFEGCPRGAHLFILSDISPLEEEPSPQDFIDVLIGLCSRCPKVPVLAAVVSKSYMGYAPGRIIYPVASQVGLKLRVFPDQSSASAWLLVGLE